MDAIKIPADMVNHEMSEKTGGTVVSIRDLMIALGASDDMLRDCDEREEILKREPWRKDSLGFDVISTLPNGLEVGFVTGSIDWSGTRFGKS